MAETPNVSTMFDSGQSWELGRARDLLGMSPKSWRRLYIAEPSPHGTPRPFSCHPLQALPVTKGFQDFINPGKGQGLFCAPHVTNSNYTKVSHQG